MGYHFGEGEFTAHFRTYFSGDWDVQYRILTHGHVTRSFESPRRVACNCRRRRIPRRFGEVQLEPLATIVTKGRQDPTAIYSLPIAPPLTCLLRLCTLCGLLPGHLLVTHSISSVRFCDICRDWRHPTQQIVGVQGHTSVPSLFECLLVLGYRHGACAVCPLTRALSSSFWFKWLVFGGTDRNIAFKGANLSGKAILVMLSGDALLKFRHLGAFCGS